MPDGSLLLKIDRISNMSSAGADSFRLRSVILFSKDSEREIWGDPIKRTDIIRLLDLLPLLLKESGPNWPMNGHLGPIYKKYNKIIPKVDIDFIYRCLFPRSPTYRCYSILRVFVIPINDSLEIFRIDT